MLLSEVEYKERMELEAWCYDFILENKSLFESLEASILVENLKLEKFSRELKFLTDDLITESVIEDSELLNEGFLTDIGIGLGSLIPGIGSAVAAGGTVYYLTNAYSSFDKGETLTGYLELLSAVLTAGQVIPVIGAAVGGVGKIIAAPFKFLFGGLIKLGSKLGTLFGKAAVEGGEQLVKTGTDDLVKLASTPGLGPAGKASEKVAGLMEKYIAFFNTGGKGAAILEKIGIDTAEFIKFCGSLKGMLGGFGRFAGKVAGKEGDELTQAVIKNVDEVVDPAKVAGVIDDQADDAIKLLQSQSDEAAANIGKAVQASDDATALATRTGKLAGSTQGAIIKVQQSFVNSSRRGINDAMRTVAKNIGPDDISKALKGRSFRAYPFDSQRGELLVKTMLKGRNPAEQAAIKAIFEGGELTIQGFAKGGAGRQTYFQVMGKGGQTVNLSPANFLDMVGDPKILTDALEATPAFRNMMMQASANAAKIETHKLLVQQATQAGKVIDDKLAAAIAAQAEKMAKPNPAAVEKAIENIAKEPGFLKKYFANFTRAADGSDVSHRNLVVLSYAAVGAGARDALGEDVVEGAQLTPEEQAFIDSMEIGSESNEIPEADLDNVLGLKNEEISRINSLIWESQLKRKIIASQKLINLV